MKKRLKCKDKESIRNAVGIYPLNTSELSEYITYVHNEKVIQDLAETEKNNTTNKQDDQSEPIDDLDNKDTTGDLVKSYKTLQNYINRLVSISCGKLNIKDFKKGNMYSVPAQIQKLFCVLADSNYFEMRDTKYKLSKQAALNKKLKANLDKYPLDKQQKDALTGSPQWHDLELKNDLYKILLKEFRKLLHTISTSTNLSQISFYIDAINSLRALQDRMDAQKKLRGAVRMITETSSAEFNKYEYMDSYISGNYGDLIVEHIIKYMSGNPLSARADTSINDTDTTLSDGNEAVQYAVESLAWILYGIPPNDNNHLNAIIGITNNLYALEETQQLKDKIIDELQLDPSTDCGFINELLQLFVVTQLALTIRGGLAYKKLTKYSYDKIREHGQGIVDAKPTPPTNGYLKKKNLAKSESITFLFALYEAMHTQIEKETDTDDMVEALNKWLKISGMLP